MVFILNKAYKLEMTPVGYSRGRSSVTQEFMATTVNDVEVDYGSTRIVFSAKGTHLLLDRISSGALTMKYSKQTIKGFFVMKKQGYVYRWEPCPFQHPNAIKDYDEHYNKA